MKAILNINDFNFDDRNDFYYEVVNARFNERLKDTKFIFSISFDHLYDDVFLKNLPEEYHNYYNCNTCKRFFSKYGKLVKINEDGSLTSLLFGGDDELVPDIFKEADKALKNAVEHAKVNSVFFTKDEILGEDGKGGFHHFKLQIPNEMISDMRANLRANYMTPSQLSNEYNERMNVAIQNCIKFTQDDVNNGLRMFESKELMASDKFKYVLVFFKELKEIYINGFFTNEGRNQFRLKIMNAPRSSVYINGTVVGQLLSDIQAGLQHYEIADRFNRMVDPINYMRAKAKPSEGNVKEAEKIISNLGLETALQRRYATIDEIKTIWTPSPIEKNETNKTVSGIFSDLETKEDNNKIIDNSIKVGTISVSTLEFVEDVLPKAKEIYMDLHYYYNYNFTAIVTQNDPKAKPIIIWDSEENRNPFSTYCYHGGSRKNSWNLKSGTTERVKVTAVTNNPACWLSDKYAAYDSCIFILENCRDLNENAGMALFPEILIRELYPVRSTISAYSNKHNLVGQEEATACGISTPSSTTDRRRYDTAIELVVVTELGNFKYKLVSWR